MNTPDRIVTYKQVDGHDLTLHLFLPTHHSDTDCRPVIIFFFGGGWQSGTPERFYHQAAYFAERGLVGISADYRTESRHRTTPRHSLQDAKSAIRFVRCHHTEFGIDPDRLIAGGGSAGGHLAMAAATTTGFNEPGALQAVAAAANALVLFNPVIDNSPAGYGYDRLKDDWQAFSPLHQVSVDTPPILMMLGDKDQLIPVSVAETLQGKMRQFGVTCRTVIYPGQSHGFFNQEPYRTRTLEEADRFLVELGYLQSGSD